MARNPRPPGEALIAGRLKLPHAHRVAPFPQAVLAAGRIGSLCRRLDRRKRRSRLRCCSRGRGLHGRLRLGDNEAGSRAGGPQPRQRPPEQPRALAASDLADAHECRALEGPPHGEVRLLRARRPGAPARPHRLPTDRGLRLSRRRGRREHRCGLPEPGERHAGVAALAGHRANLEAPAWKVLGVGVAQSAEARCSGCRTSESPTTPARREPRADREARPPRRAGRPPSRDSRARERPRPRRRSPTRGQPREATALGPGQGSLQRLDRCTSPRASSPAATGSATRSATARAASPPRRSSSASAGSSLKADPGQTDLRGPGGRCGREDRAAGRPAMRDTRRACLSLARVVPGTGLSPPLRRYMHGTPCGPRLAPVRGPLACPETFDERGPPLSADGSCCARRAWHSGRPSRR